MNPRRLAALGLASIGLGCLLIAVVLPIRGIWNYLPEANPKHVQFLFSGVCILGISAIAVIALLERPWQENRWLWRDGLLFGMFVLLIFLSNGVERSTGDSVPAKYLPVSLLRYGRLDLDSFPDLVSVQGKQPYYVIPQKGHFYSAYPPGSALLSLPVYLVPVLTGFRFDESSLSPLSKLSAAIIAALSAWLFFLSLRPCVSEGKALVLGLAYALGTSILSASSQTLWQHGPSHLCLSWSLYHLSRATTKPIHAVWSGIPLGLSLICRPIDFVLIVPVIIYIFWRYVRLGIGTVLLALVPASVLLWYNWALFGHPLFFGLYGNLSAKVRFLQSFSSKFWVGLVGILVSPSRGLFVYSPFLLFSFWGLWQAWRSRGDALLRALGIGIILSLWFYAKWFMWWGGYSYGPRLISDLIPYLCFALWPFIASVNKRPWLKTLFTVSILISVGIHTLGAFLPGGWDATPSVDIHQERLWSLKDSQIGFYIRQCAELWFKKIYH